MKVATPTARVTRLRGRDLQLPQLCENPHATAADVRAMQWNQAEVIFKEKYCDAMRCDALESGVDCGILDYGVNRGVGRAGKARHLSTRDAPNLTFCPAPIRCVLHQLGGHKVHDLMVPLLADIPRSRLRQASFFVETAQAATF